MMSKNGSAAPWRRADIIEHCELMARGFRALTGRDLMSPQTGGPALSQALYEARFVLVSHGTEADPLFNYANRAAQNLWALNWSEFIGMPSRRSAEQVERSERSQALRNAMSSGVMEGYRGIRISSGGRRFLIEDGVIWNLADPSGYPRGQAATFSRWSFL